MNIVTTMTRPGSFGDILYQRAQFYFNSNTDGKFANHIFHIKAIFLLAIYATAYSLFSFAAISFIQLLLLACILGFCHVFIPVNIGHDAIHGSVSSSNWINKLGLFAFELTGSNSYMYKKKHLEAHYNKENGSKTIAIESQGLLLQKENKSGKSNLPVFFYLFYAQYMIFLRDYILFFGSKEPIPAKQIIKLIICKAAYFIAFLVLPFANSPHSVWQIIIALLLMYLFVTIFLVVILLMPTEKLEQPRNTENGHNDQWLVEILEHNVDFSPSNIPLNLIAGGANLNVVHYLFPSSNHVHYNKLAVIIEDTAAEFGYRYRKQQVADVLGIHFNYLKNIQASK